MAGFAAVLAGLAADRVSAQLPSFGSGCPDVARVDAVAAPLLALLPESALRAGFPDVDAGRCDDPSPDGDRALALAVSAALAALPAGCADEPGLSARVLLERAAATARIGYGRNDPLAAIHRPYRVTAYAGAQVETVEALGVWQPVDTAPALDAWQVKLEALADALLGVAQGLRADEAKGCVPPVATGRATLDAMDAFVLVQPDQHPLVQALRARIADPVVRDPAVARAMATLTRRTQPAMALVRDTMATLTRKGRTEIGVWSLPDGDALYAANFARAGDTAQSPADAQAFARDEAKRIAALLDRRLAARGAKSGSIAARVAAAFSAQPGLVAGDDASGHAALGAAARSRIEAAHALLGKLVPAADATVAPPRVASLPDLGRVLRGGSFYLPAGPGREAVLWLDDRSVYTLPIPGVSPIAFHLGLPGLHLLASAGATTPTARLVRAARWPAMTEGWGCYAERLASEQGLFVRDPWGDVARLSDELLRAARLVVDVGIHAQRWTRAEAEQAMTDMTGAPQSAVIDRIIAMPGEAASYTLGLDRLLNLREIARKKAGKHFDQRVFHAAVLAGGARSFAALDRAIG